MLDYIELGSAPTDEQCAQVGSANYQGKALRECASYKRLLQLLFPDWEAKGCRFMTRAFPHDFGTYHEVVVYYNNDNRESIDYAIHIENNLPEQWATEVPQPDGSTVRFCYNPM